jgi:hypothetical protein
LEAFFSALAANGLAINLEKCIFAVSFLELLGHMISVAGLAPTAEHTAQSTLVLPLRMSSQAKISQHGKQLPPFSSRLYLHFAANN